MCFEAMEIALFRRFRGTPRYPPYFLRFADFASWTFFVVPLRLRIEIKHYKCVNISSDILVPIQHDMSIEHCT